ncbi:hypothetical protein F5B20DRAFT_588907 [Whalleya microplaca]|nr:hypothetical protein F5B20DRAFT_588907 [Whalleya microplaca]
MANSNIIQQSTQQGEDATTTGEDESERSSQKLWTSIWLLKGTLLGFFMLFTSLWMALVLLMHYNIRENGFTLALSSNHYAWTYGPTVILTIVVSLWRQVDYHCKLSQPWCTMKRGPAIPSKTILLDYISPLQTTSLWKALKNKHWAVLSSIVGSIILQGVIVASTTILISSPTTLTGVFPIIITTKLDGDNYLKYLTNAWNKPVINGSEFNPVYTNISDSPNDVVFHNFDFTNSKVNVTEITGPTKAFVPQITCEIPDNISYVDIGAGWFGLDFETSSCSLSQWHLMPLCPPATKRCQQYQMIRVNCSGGDETTDDIRFALLATDLKISGNITISNDSFNTWEVLKKTAAICKVDYGIQDLNLTKSLAGNSSTLGPLHTPDQKLRIPNLGGIQLGEIIYSMLGDPALQDEGETASHPIFGLMNSTLNTSSTELDVFFNAKVMVQAFITSFSGVACQLIQTEFLSPDQAPEEGQGLYTEDRLYIQELSTWLMIGGLAILSVLSLDLLFIAPRDVNSQEPNLASHGVLLANSPSMQALLGACGSLRTSELTKWLQDFEFRTIADGGAFYVEALKSTKLSNTVSNSTTLQNNTEAENQMEVSHIPNDLKVKKGSWIPLFAKYPMVAITLTLPILSIACVEILYRVSERNGGFVDGSNSVYYVRYPSIIAAITMASLFHSLDFTITAFAPFHALRSKRVSASQGVLTNLVEMIPALAFYYTLRGRVFGAFFSNIARVMGSTLTIIVSGLWIIDSSMMDSIQVNASAATTWDISWKPSCSNDAGIAGQLPKAINNASSSPQGVYDDLVFPDIVDIAVTGAEPGLNISDPVTQSRLRLTVNISALRPKLRCEPVTEIHRNAKDWRYLEATYPLPRYCHGGPGGNLSYGKIIRPSQNSHLPSQNRRFADNPDGCPSIGILFGRLEPNRMQTENITGLFCFQEIQQAEAGVPLDLQGTNPQSTLRLNPSNIRSPPLVDESTVMLLANGTPDSIDSVTWDWINHEPYDMSGFFVPITYGPNMPSLEAMVGPNNMQVLIDAINRLYNMCMPLNRSANLPNERFTVDYISKLILRILLAIMTVLGGLGFWLTDIRHTLPRNPFSIASLMALFAGSEFCERNNLPAGAEWMTKPELETLFGSRQFSLGWWQARGSVGSGIEDERVGDRETQRFGIDIGIPYQRGFLKKKNKAE